MIKFTLFSASAGIIQLGAFALLEIFIKTYWIPYLTSLILSILWNFTLNRRFTFKSAACVPVAMAKVFGFYLVFTPLSTWLGNLAESRGVHDFLILGITMASNFVLEFLFSKFVVYRGNFPPLILMQNYKIVSREVSHLEFEGSCTTYFLLERKEVSIGTFE